MFANPFSDEELAGRLDRVRAEIAGRRLDVALISTPENIFYLTGLDHWGYFAPHLLVVPLEGRMTLITRAMERVTIERQVRNALFKGHGDSETAADLVVRHLGERSHARSRAEAALAEATDVIAGRSGGRRRIGVETWSSGHSYGFGAALRERMEDAEWADLTGLVDGLRLVKSAEEQALMRRAARAFHAELPPKRKNPAARERPPWVLRLRTCATVQRQEWSRELPFAISDTHSELLEQQSGGLVGAGRGSQTNLLRLQTA